VTYYEIPDFLFFRVQNVVSCGIVDTSGTNSMYMEVIIYEVSFLWIFRE